MSQSRMKRLDSANDRRPVDWRRSWRAGQRLFLREGRCRLAAALLLLWLTDAGTLQAQPPAGSQLAAEENACAMCHGMADLWKKESLRLFKSAEKLADDIHWQKGVNCHDCHGGNPRTFKPSELHAREDGFRELAELRKVCANCHQKQVDGLAGSVHASLFGAGDDAGQASLSCASCHRDDPHQILSVHDRRSPVFLDAQVQVCGDCHEESFATYRESSHGHGLYRSGLLTTAACADCHGAHAVRGASDPRSMLHPGNVGTTCGKCHRFIEEEIRLSVHGQGEGPGHAAGRPAPGGNAQRNPTCTDCHQGHDLTQAQQAGLRLALPRRCGSCHQKLADHYALSVHGELTELGYGPAASCSDCHGSHTIWPASDTRSRLSPANRWATCRQCHTSVGANSNFLDFAPHADHRNAQEFPLLYYIYVGLLCLLVAVFGFFGLHSLMWFGRAQVHVWRHGRPSGLVPGTMAYRRFDPAQRLAHLVLMVSFLGLALTGLPLKYSQHEWAKVLAHCLGGFESTGIWHRVFGVLLFVVFLASLVGMLRVARRRRRNGELWRQVVFGPDSLMPTWRDLGDFGRMVRWLVGLGPKPTFNRWSYWEKLDFWGACADVVIIGVSGLILWFPELFCVVLPGIAVNIAKVIHSTQALLATGFVFAIHFFNTHLRADKFPADLSMMTGLVSQHELIEDRPEHYDRLARQGQLAELHAVVPSAKALWAYRLAGLVALVIGFGLLVAMLWVGLRG